MEEKVGTISVDRGAYEGIRKESITLQPNSHKSKSSVDKAPKLEKVIKGAVVTKKKPLSKRFAETFLGTDREDVMTYIIHDVVIPAAKSTISDVITGGIEMLLFGETRGSRTRRDKGKSYVSYSGYYNNPRKEASAAESRKRARHNFDDIILESRGEAEEVLSVLVDNIDIYGMSTVADLYDLVGITSNFTDNKYGWTNLASATVSRVRDGYLISLPKPVVLD